MLASCLQGPIRNIELDRVVRMMEKVKMGENELAFQSSKTDQTNTV